MINSRSNMKRDKSVACRDAGLMRRDAKAHERPVAQSKREDHSDGQPGDGNHHQSHIHAIMHELCCNPLPIWGRLRQRGALPAHDPKPQR